MTDPSTDLTPEVEDRYAALSDWDERLEDLPGDATVLHGCGEAPGRALLAHAPGGDEALDRAIGRPNLQGRRASGTSPVRQVRLPHDLAARSSLGPRESTQHRARS